MKKFLACFLFLLTRLPFLPLFVIVSIILTPFAFVADCWSLPTSFARNECFESQVKEMWLCTYDMIQDAYKKFIYLLNH